MGPRRPSVRALQGERRDRRHGAQVRSRNGARVARPQAAHHRSVGERHGAVSGGRARVGQGRQPHRLRRVHRARSGRRGAHPRQRDVVEQARQASVEDPQRRRHRGRDGPRRGRHRAAHFARPEAGRDQSLARPRRQVPGGLEDPGQGPEPHRVRRVRRSRRGNRRPDPHLRHVVEQADQPPVGGPEEGRRRRGGGVEHRRREPAALPRPEAARDRRLGRLLLESPRRRHGAGQGRADDELRRVRRAGRGHRRG